MSHVLSANAAVAVATFGALLHSGAHARREFCVAIVGEAVETKADFDAIIEAAKEAADYNAMEDAERALFRKQVQYCRAIAGGWSKLGAANQRLFVGGGLPASSAAKLIKDKGAVKVSQDAPETGSGSEAAPSTEAPSTVLSAVSSAVIGGAEAAVIFATWLDGKDGADMSEAEAKAVGEVIASLEAFKARLASAATVRLAA